MLTFLAMLPWEPIGPEEDHGVVVEAEVLGRLIVSSALALPCAVAGGLLVMLVGNRRRATFDTPPNTGVR